MDRALLHTDNAYRLGDAVSARGHICRTHQASNTAFRGFGGPQVRFNACCLSKAESHPTLNKFCMHARQIEPPNCHQCSSCSGERCGTLW